MKIMENRINSALSGFFCHFICAIEYIVERIESVKSVIESVVLYIEIRYSNHLQ